MEFIVTRRIIRGAWLGTTEFDPWLFRHRLSRARTGREELRIEKFTETESEAIYEVEGAWLVFLDLSGPDAHYCTCPDGARKVELSLLGGSLCEHVLVCLLRDGKAHLLAVHLALMAKAIAARPLGRK